jgi:DUF971 family protein
MRSSSPVTAPRPEGLHSDVGAGILEIFWNDGMIQRLDTTLLRNSCLCAECKSAHAHPERAIDTPDEIGITDIRPVGAYGMQLLFSDGHERGIYPWSYLRRLGV